MSLLSAEAGLTVNYELLKAKPVGRYSLRSDSLDLLAVPRTMFKTLPDGMSFPLTFAEGHQYRLSNTS